MIELKRSKVKDNVVFVGLRDATLEERRIVENLVSYRGSVEYGFISREDSFILVNKYREKIDVLVDDEVWMMLDDFRKELDFVNRLKRGEGVEYSFDLRRWIKTMEYIDQRGAVLFTLWKQRVGLFDKMGIGKTFETLCAFAGLRELYGVNRMLVICVNSVKWNWEKEVKKHTLFSCRVVGNGTVEVLKDLEEYENTLEDVLVIHYDCLRNERVKQKVLELMEELGFDMIVVDECQYVKNSSAQRTKAVFDLLGKRRSSVCFESKVIGYVDGSEVVNRVDEKNRSWVVFLTGTPLGESALDVFNFIKFVGLDVRYRKFDSYFVERELRVFGGNEVNVVVGFKNLEDLKVYLGGVSMGRKREEVRGMPEKVVVEREISMDDEVRKVYNGIKEGVIKELRKQGKLVRVGENLGKIIRLRQVLSCPGAIGLGIKNLKVEVLSEFVRNEVDEDEKVVVWCVFRDTVFDVERSLKDLGVLRLIGGEELKDFEERMKDVKVIVATIKKGGVGIDFLKDVDVAVYLDLPFSHMELVQSQDRLVRRGREKVVVINEFFVRNSVDRLVKRIIERKEEMVDIVMGVEELEGLL